jgi:hypothetical protein
LPSAACTAVGYSAGKSAVTLAEGYSG